MKFTNLSILGPAKILFVGLFLSYAYFYQGGFSNSNSRIDMAAALAWDGTYAIDSFHLNTIDKATFEDHYYLEKAPGASYLVLPLAWLGSKFLPKWSISTESATSDWFAYLCTLLTVSLISAIGGVGFYKLLLKLNVALSESQALFTSMVVFLWTPCLAYSTVLFSHQIAGSFLVCAVYCGISNRRLPSVILFAATLVVEFTTAFVVLGGILACRRWRNEKACPWLELGLPLALAGLAVITHNLLSFGHPFSMGYGMLQGSTFAAGMSQGFFGIRFPSPANVAQLLFGQYRGLFIYAPILLVALASFSKWPKTFTRTGLVYLWCGCLASLLLHSGYYFWQGGVAFGPRHLVPLIPLLGLGFAFTPGKWWRSVVVIALILVSLAINLAGTAVTLYLDERETKPLQMYWTLLRDNQISINPGGFATSFAELSERWWKFDQFPWASWNWGERWGLRGVISLLPLLLLWLATLSVAYRRARTVRSSS